MMIRRHLMSCLVVPVCLVSSPTSAAPPPDYKGTPFTDEFHQAGPQGIPGIVQCALYDLGGEGVAYHDTTKENEGSDVLNCDPWAIWVFEKIGPAGPVPATEAARK